MIVRGLAPDGKPSSMAQLVDTLNRYAEVVAPWAQAVATAMVADIDRRGRVMWRRNSGEIGRSVRHELERAPTGHVMAQLQAEQVKLIKSLPLEAAQRVHELAVNAIPGGRRASSFEADILATGHVTEARARLIARTETTRATSNLMQARAQYAGSDGYVWRTSGDFDVRPSHNVMEGRYVRWGHPPTLDGLVGHAGCLPNCRCFAEPIFPDD
jgi:SPP1 gp7 family putative phage head morphogenesis protein